MPLSKKQSRSLRSNPRFKNLINLKNLLFVFAGLIVVYYSARIIFKPNLSQYPALNSCFSSTVHKVLLCNTSPKYVNLKQIANSFIHSVLISEDDSFYIHQGVDWREFKKSFIQNWKLKRFARGGSTITQQLVKNAYLSQNKSILRKFKEILLAQQVETKYPKSVILEKYLNVIELGTDIYGVKSAASFYFSKSPSNLNILEATYLTTLLPNPKLYSKSFFNKQLPGWQSERIEILLKRLLRRQRISENLYQAALSKIHMFPWTNIDLMETDRLDNDNLDFLNNLPDENLLTDEGFIKPEDLETEDIDPAQFEETLEEKSFGKTEYSEETEETKAEPVTSTDVIDNNDTIKPEDNQENLEDVNDSPVDTSDPDF
jgi:monofunctional biosynthetic peptidoglycan transglycosylase